MLLSLRFIVDASSLAIRTRTHTDTLTLTHSHLHNPFLSLCFSVALPSSLQYVSHEHVKVNWRSAVSVIVRLRPSSTVSTPSSESALPLSPTLSPSAPLLPPPATLESFLAQEWTQQPGTSLQILYMVCV